MQIKDLLEIELLTDAGLEILAGADRLNRQVSWVHTGEIGGITQYRSGGEPLLTQATGLGQQPEQLRRYVRELASADAACVIIELGRGFRSVPAVMIEEAARADLVLISLDNEVPFVAVTRIARTELISSAHTALQRAIAIDDALNTLILEGASLSAVLDLLAERLKNPVILEDGARARASHRCCATGRRTPVRVTSGTNRRPCSRWTVHPAVCGPRSSSRVRNGVAFTSSHSTPH